MQNGLVPSLAILQKQVSVQQCRQVLPLNALHDQVDLRWRINNIIQLWQAGMLNFIQALNLLDHALFARAAILKPLLVIDFDCYQHARRFVLRFLD